MAVFTPHLEAGLFQTRWIMGTRARKQKTMMTAGYFLARQAGSFFPSGAFFSPAFSFFIFSYLSFTYLKISNAYAMQGAGNTIIIIICTQTHTQLVFFLLFCLNC